MLLTDDDVKEFKELYAEEFNEEITDADARTMASQLIQLYDTLSDPLPGELPDELAKMIDPTMLDP